MKRGKHILILEDEVLLQEELKRLVEKSEPDCMVLETGDIKEAYQMANEYFIDLFLLDIILNPFCKEKREGLTFAENIRKIEEYEVTPIVFITSIAYYEKQAFHNIHCYDYLLKPIEEETAIEIFQRLLKNRRKRQTEYDERYIEFVDHGVIFPIRIKEIDFIEYAQRKLHVYTRGKKYSFKNITLSECIERMKGSSIIQIHKSILVNARKIITYDSVNRIIQIEIESEKRILDVGQKYKENIKGFIRDDTDNSGDYL